MAPNPTSKHVVLFYGNQGSRIKRMTWINLGVNVLGLWKQHISDHTFYAQSLFKVEQLPSPDEGKKIVLKIWEFFHLKHC